MEKTEEAKAGGKAAGYAHVGQVWHGKNECGTAFNREMQMMSDSRRLVRPGAAAQWSTANTAAI